jgi:Arc/MetJ-type ribon-helix-helix transcriptional regulator
VSRVATPGAGFLLSTSGRAPGPVSALLPPRKSGQFQTLRRTLYGTVHGMAAIKVTITLPERQLEEIRKRVAAQDSPSVSGFIQQAVQKSIQNAAEFRALVEQALEETGGPLRPKERAWARKMLSARKPR